MFSRFEQLFLWEHLPLYFLQCEAKFNGRSGKIGPHNWAYFGRVLEQRQRERDVNMYGYVEPVIDGLDIEAELTELRSQCRIIQSRHENEPCKKELMNMALSVFWRTIRLDKLSRYGP